MTTWNILGLMSGTSGDGIDGALVAFSPTGFSLLWHDSWVFLPAQRRRLQALMKQAGADEVTRSAHYVAELYARAVDCFRKRHDGRIDVLAAHGQTLMHCPEAHLWEEIPVRGTLQVLNSGLLAERSGLPVISDFRLRDMAVAGQGAPLVPLGDLRFFGGQGKDVGVLNIGGIANVTVVRPYPAVHVAQAFDTGPGNMLMDAWMVRVSRGEKNYDERGEMASRGHVHDEILKKLLTTPYFSLKPPKSTGRELFGSEFLQTVVALFPAGVAEADVMATLLAFTVDSIAMALEAYVFPHGRLTTLLVAGGGARNAQLMKNLEKRLAGRCEVISSDVVGVPVMAREAMAFAALGEAFLRNLPGNVPQATGADKPVVLGCFTPGTEGVKAVFSL